jgi:hypothetical protein
MAGKILLVDMHDIVIYLQESTNTNQHIMDVNTLENIHHDAISKITEEYRRLMGLSFPSDEQLNRIEEILKLAISDIKINESLSKVDEEITSEIALQVGNALYFDDSLKNDLFSGKYPHIFSGRSQKITLSVCHNQALALEIKCYI